MDRRGGRRGRASSSSQGMLRKSERTIEDDSGSRRGRFGSRSVKSEKDGDPLGEQIKAPTILTKPQPVVDDNDEEWPAISATMAIGSVWTRSRTHSPATSTGGLLDLGNKDSKRKEEGVESRKLVLERKGSGGNAAAPPVRGTIQIQSSLQQRTDKKPTPEIQRRKVATQAGLEDSAEKSLKGGIHVISEHMDWIDNAQDYLNEQSDFLVVGAMGPQGTGKSTLLSMLGGNDALDMFRQYIFRPASREATETCKHQTAGVQFYVTPSRVILLDSQPLASPSILDEIIRLDRRYNYEYKTVENFVEVESVQIMAFLLQVCHVVLVITDWFLDMNLLRVIRNAEMVKPSTSLSDSAGYLDHSPHLVFVQQKGKSDDYHVSTIKSRCKFLENLLTGTKANFKSGLSLSKTSIPSFKNGSLKECQDVNYFLLPEMKLRGQKPDTSIKYKTVPEYDALIKEMRLLIRSLPRPPFAQSGVMTEKNWFQYAGRAWDSVRKSHMIAEFGRTLT